MLPPVTAVTQEPVLERRPAGPPPDEVYRRRRAAVIAGLALAALARIAVLVLLRGDDEGGTVTVPNVVGRSQVEATRILEDAGVRVQVTQRDSPTAVEQVSDQDPDAGQVVRRGSTVTIFVARPTTTTAPATTRATTATTNPPTTPATTATTAPPTTQATVPPTTAPATTRPPVTQAPPTSTIIIVPTSIIVTPTRP